MRNYGFLPVVCLATCRLQVAVPYNMKWEQLYAARELTSGFIALAKDTAELLPS